MSTHTEATLVFQDGVEHALTVESGQTVLEAALAAEAPILYQCTTGSCGSCLARLESGQADHRAGSTSSLLSAEREQGYRLLCVTEAQGNCRFSPSRMTALRERGGRSRPNASSMRSNAWRAT
jgi:benzoate/toluate 1,2-dioxygenase reductase subunit